MDKKTNNIPADNINCSTDMSDITDKDLVKIAKNAKMNSYSPYSNYRVGAALLTKSGKIYTGCNIENTSYGATCCAERTAIYKAVSEGEREFEAIAIKSDSDEFTYPCGICRQVISEFSENLRVIVSDNNGNIKSMQIKELLPNAFFKEGYL